MLSIPLPFSVCRLNSQGSSAALAISQHRPEPEDRAHKEQGHSSQQRDGRRAVVDRKKRWVMGEK